MAFENLIIRDAHKIGGIVIDGIISEITVRTMRMTTNPVEDGNTISDHIVKEPMQYTLEGAITDTPMGLAGIQSAVTGVKDSVSGLFGASEDSGQTRSQNVYFALVNLLESRGLLKVDTSLKTYDNLVFETITVNQDKTNSRAVFFTATFKQALITVSSSSELDAENITTDADKAGQAAELENGLTSVNPASAADNSLIEGALSA